METAHVLTSLIAVALILNSFGNALGAEVNPMTSVTNPLYELSEDCDFTVAANNSTTQYECSPQLRDSYFRPFIGVLINGPATITWPKGASEEGNPPGPNGQTTGPLRIMISGVVQLPFNAMGLNGEFADKVLIVAVDRKTANTYSGKIWFPESLPEPEPDNPDDLFPETGEENTADLTAPVASYFNIDLLHNLEVPITSAVYSVYAQIGEYKSNVLRIETRVE